MNAKLYVADIICSKFTVEWDILFCTHLKHFVTLITGKICPPDIFTQEIASFEHKNYAFFLVYAFPWDHFYWNCRHLRPEWTYGPGRICPPGHIYPGDSWTITNITGNLGPPDTIWVGPLFHSHRRKFNQHKHLQTLFINEV